MMQSSANSVERGRPFVRVLSLAANFALVFVLVAGAATLTRLYHGLQGLEQLSARDNDILAAAYPGSSFEVPQVADAILAKHGIDHPPVWTVAYLDETARPGIEVQVSQEPVGLLSFAHVVDAEQVPTPRNAASTTALAPQIAEGAQRLDGGDVYATEGLMVTRAHLENGVSLLSTMSFSGQTTPDLGNESFARP